MQLQAVSSRNNKQDKKNQDSWENEGNNMVTMDL